MNNSGNQNSLLSVNKETQPASTCAPVKAPDRNMRGVESVGYLVQAHGPEEGSRLKKTKLQLAASVSAGQRNRGIGFKKTGDAGSKTKFGPTGSPGCMSAKGCRCLTKDITKHL
eukprot:957849-Pelagomonas_calceolata.AAC.1